MVKSSWKTALLLFILAAMLLSFSLRFRLLAGDASGDDLFEFVWDDSLGGPPVFGGHYIVSSHVFPLKVYVLSLPDVDNYRVSNHSEIIEGVKQATKIYPGDAGVKELVIPLWFDLFMKLNVSISFHLVDDWQTYKSLVESGNNTILVNTYDEYLAVPEGYTKEEWVDKVACFMLNSWGTWVHVGGYPFYRVWYQNGTKEEWGENGFKRLMSHVGKPNITCYPPPDWPPEDPATFSIWASQHLGINWYWEPTPIAAFHGANQGYPINYEDFEEQYLCSIYSYERYKPGAIIRYSQNLSAFNFGIYIHMSAWQFYTGGGNELPAEFATGFISTAAAIYEEFSYAAGKLYGREGNSAIEVIQKAEKEGRTVGLAEAKNLFRGALDAFAYGNYKLSAAYASQAKQTAEKATAPNKLPQTIAAIAMITIPIGIAAYYKINNRNKRKRSGCAESK